MIFVLSGRFLFCQEFEEFEIFSLITYPLRAVNVNSLFLDAKIFLTKKYRPVRLKLPNTP